MKQLTKNFRFEFVKHIPQPIENGVLYISFEFATAIHLCACGCGSEVVTKLSSERWKLIFEEGFISLDPSIGNFDLACKSHYFIIRNKVVWAKSWSMKKVMAEREKAKNPVEFPKTSLRKIRKK